MPNPLFEDLNAAGLISDESLKKIREKYAAGLFSLHWELRILLYLGVMMLCTGLGILIYKNLDSISHQVALSAIGLLSTSCFIWCYRQGAPFSPERVAAPDPLFDYILLLGVLSFLSLIGYWQFQYEIFGTRYGLATFIPMMLLFWKAYYFDHLGILTMAIANLAVWLGISVSPKQVLQNGNFNSEKMIYTYLALGLFLLVMAFISRRYKFKAHFAFSYQNYGLHITFIFLLAGYFHYDYLTSLIWLLAFGITVWIAHRHALNIRSYYFVVVGVLYSYAALSGFVTKSLFLLGEPGVAQVLLLYYAASGIGVLAVLMHLNKKMKAP